MLVMASLLMADDLFEMEQRLQAAEAAAASGSPAANDHEARPPAESHGEARGRDCRRAGGTLSIVGRGCPVRQAIHPLGH